MCKTKKIAPKEKAVYDGVLHLVMQGAEPYSLTVQQIADAAKIGKGTVYEYFSSREDIMARTLKYCQKNQLEKLTMAVELEHTFEKKFVTMLETMHEMLTTKNLGLESLLLQVVTCKSPHAKNDNSNHIIVEGLTALFEKVLKQGIQENIIEQSQCEKYGLLALSGVVLSYLNATHIFPDTKQFCEFQQLEYEILRKALS